MITTTRTLVTLLAWRYIKGNKEQSLSVMAIICFCAILIGSGALTLVSCVMNGFEQATHEKLRGIHSQIIMRTAQGNLKFDRIKEILDSEFPEIEACGPTGFKHALIHTSDAHDTNSIVVLKGIHPVHEMRVKTIAQKIIPPASGDDLSILLANNQFIIGKKLAEMLHLTVGDSMTIWSSATEEYGEDMTFDKVTVTVSALFDTGIDEFDTGLLYCSLDCLKTIFNQGISEININLTPGADDRTTITKLKQRFHLDTHSWKDLYPALVSALKLEKYAMFFVLMLIIIVASMNIISLLFMYVTQKQKDIAILKACGASQKSINALFMTIGIGISGCAAISGELIAYAICLLLKRYPFISLPDTYYVSHLPICIEYKTFLLVFMVVITISICASFFSVQRSKKLLISSVLKGE